MRITMTRRRAMLQCLEKTYFGMTTGLQFNSSFELLVAVILSAQCTDVRVNIITRRLFPRWNSPAKMLELDVSQMEELIHDCGLYRAKAKNLLGTCRRLIDEYHGEVPGTMEDLLTLPGVGRKTANVMLSHQFNVPAIAVDTHVFRVSNRIGLTNRSKTPLQTELTLEKYIPSHLLPTAHHWLILHGRYVCTARAPKCAECGVSTWCRKYAEDNKRSKTE